MNVTIIMGRTTADIELRKTNSNKSFVNFTLAVRRNYSKNETDFFDCVAWDKTAETIARYVHKGSMIAVQGRLATRSWEDKNGSKHKAVEIVADNVSFCGGKTENNTMDITPPADGEEDTFRDIPNVDLPF